LKSINKKMQDIRRKIADIQCKNTSVYVNAEVLDFQFLPEWLSRIIDKMTDSIWDKVIF